MGWVLTRQDRCKIATENKASDSRSHVDNGKTPPAHVSLQIGARSHLEQEVEEQMKDTAMQEHRRDKTEPLIRRLSSRRDGGESTDVGYGADGCGVIWTLKVLVV